MFTYRSFSHRTKGASHHKENLPCQDAAKHYDSDKMAIAIIADGHGSSQYFRSDVGSRIATEVALRSIKEFIEQSPEKPDVFIDKDEDYATRNGQKLFARLVGNIISTWLDEVTADELAFPLAQDDRLAKIEEKYRTRYLNDRNRQYFAHAYGSTLIAVAVTYNYWFGLHIGDGRCEVLFEDGTWAQPIPWDDKCFLNSTTSICDDDAFQRARVWYGPTEKDSRLPVALFVNSDGVDDTYSVDEELKQKQLADLYRSIVLSFAKDGFESTDAQLPTLIERFATSGSQDDVSISGIIHTELPAAFIEYLDTQEKKDKADEKAKEERKRAEAKTQAFQAAQARAEQAAKKKADAQKAAQKAEQELNERNLQLIQIQEEARRFSRSLAAAKQEKQRAEAEYTKAQADYRTTNSEHSEAQRGASIADSERVAAESQALQNEEVARTLGLQLKTAFSRIPGSITGSRFRTELNQFKQDIFQAARETADGVSDTFGDLFRSIQDSIDQGKK